MSTILDLRTKARNLFIKIDPNAKIRDTTSLDAYINDGYLQVQKDGGFARPECSEFETQSTVSGTKLYPKPSNFQKIDLVRYEGRPLKKTSRKTVLISNDTATGNPIEYYICGQYIGLSPIPNTVGTLDILYYKKLPKITDTQDSLLAEDMDNAICERAAYMAFISVNKPDKAGTCLALYQNSINTLLATYIYDDTNISFNTQRYNESVDPYSL